MFLNFDNVQIKVLRNPLAFSKPFRILVKIDRLQIATLTIRTEERSDVHWSLGGGGLDVVSWGLF